MGSDGPRFPDEKLLTPKFRQISRGGLTTGAELPMSMKPPTSSDTQMSPEKQLMPAARKISPERRERMRIESHLMQSPSHPLPRRRQDREISGSGGDREDDGSGALVLEEMGNMRQAASPQPGQVSAASFHERIMRMATPNKS